MGYWENTTYVQHGRVADVASCLASLFTKEGMALAEAPSQRVHPGIGEPMQYDAALRNDLWGVAVFQGAPSWTIVKTAPLELLGERRPGADRMRLADACSALAVSAVQVNVYDGIGIVLVEVSPQGEVFLSGFNDRGPDNFVWHSERIEETNVVPRIRIHAIGDDVLGDRLDSTKVARGLATRLGGENEAWCDNATSVETLVTHSPLRARGGVVLYFRWTGAGRALRAGPSTGR